MTSMQLSVQVVVGGTKIGMDNKRLERRIPDILIATPGEDCELNDRYTSLL